MTETGRRTGWASRKRLHVINAKAPETAVARDPRFAYGYEKYETWPEHLFDDACDGWHGCGVHGCCVDEDWAIHVMPSMCFSVDGIVHVTLPKNGTAICGEVGNWPVPSLASTDEAIAYARQYRGDFREVTCLYCIVYASFWNVSWLAP